MNMIDLAGIWWITVIALCALAFAIALSYGALALRHAAKAPHITRRRSRTDFHR